MSHLSPPSSGPVRRQRGKGRGPMADREPQEQAEASSASVPVPASSSSASSSSSISVTAAASSSTVTSTADPKSQFWQSLSPLNHTKMGSPKTPSVSRILAITNNSPQPSPNVAMESPAPFLRDLSRSFTSPMTFQWGAAPEPTAERTPTVPRSPRSRLGADTPERSRHTAHDHGTSSKLREAIEEQFSHSSIGVHLPPPGARAVCITINGNGHGSESHAKPFVRGLQFGSPHLKHDHEEHGVHDPDSSNHHEEHNDVVEETEGGEDDGDERDLDEEDAASMSEIERVVASTLVSLSPQKTTHLKRTRLKSSEALKEENLEKKGSPLRKKPVATSTGESAIPPQRVSTSALGLDKMRSPTGGKQQKTQRRKRPAAGVGTSGPCRGCNCKKSKCLKLYCECFARQGYCNDGCSCIECQNVPGEEDARQKAIESITNRDPNAFFRGQGKTLNKTKGCHCKKSHCQKKYCECYQSGISCTDACKCQDCQNGKRNHIHSDLGRGAGALHVTTSHPFLSSPSSANITSKNHHASAADLVQLEVDNSVLHSLGSLPPPDMASHVLADLTAAAESARSGSDGGHGEMEEEEAEDHSSDGHEHDHGRTSRKGMEVEDSAYEDAEGGMDAPTKRRIAGLYKKRKLRGRSDLLELEPPVATL